MMISKFLINNLKSYPVSYQIQSWLLSKYPIRNFVKKKKKGETEIKGLRKSLTPKEVSKQKPVDNEIIIGPSLIITPKEVTTITEESNAAHNWTKRELELAFHKAFPQTFAIAHRGLKYFNKFHFKHPEINLMTAEKIRSFLIDNEIQRVLVFTDGWSDSKINNQNGDLYINSTGYIKSTDPESNRPADITENNIVKNPIIYFLRDLITEADDLGDVNVYVFQNIQHYTNYLTTKTANTTIDHHAIRNKLLNYSSQGVDNIQLFNKLCLTSFMNSLVRVNKVHSVFMPLVFQYTEPGITTAQSILFKTLKEAFIFDKQEKKVPNIQHLFSMISSQRAWKLICELLRLKW